jgi:hypothetical protein
VNGFISTEILPTRSALTWEQWLLPRQAARAGAQALHLLTLTPALAARIPLTCSPTYWGPANPGPASGLSERLGRSLAAGGLANLRRLDWPADLPVPATVLPIAVQPPRVHPLFHANDPSLPVPAAFQAIRRPGRAKLDLAGAPFFLYGGSPRPELLRLLLSAWSWAAPALGEDFFLALPNLAEAEQNLVREWSAEQEFAPSLLFMETTELAELAWLYRQAAAVIQLEPSQPWGDPAALALAAGRPLVGLEEPRIVARAGPAAFLTPPGDPRLLGAALVTVGSDEVVAQALMDAAQTRAQGWLFR